MFDGISIVAIKGFFSCAGSSDRPIYDYINPYENDLPGSSNPRPASQQPPSFPPPIPPKSRHSTEPRQQNLATPETSRSVKASTGAPFSPTGPSTIDRSLSPSPHNFSTVRYDNYQLIKSPVNNNYDLAELSFDSYYSLNRIQRDLEAIPPPESFASNDSSLFSASPSSASSRSAPVAQSSKPDLFICIRPVRANSQGQIELKMSDHVQLLLDSGHSLLVRVFPSGTVGYVPSDSVLPVDHFLKSEPLFV